MDSSRDGTDRIRITPLDRRAKRAMLPWIDDWKLASPAGLSPGTVCLLILQIPTPGAMHGYGIAHRTGRTSEDVPQIGEWSLYRA